MVAEQITKKDFENAIVNHRVCIEEALSHMGNEAAIVVDDDNKLCGIVTDGDIRRGFLAGAGMQTPISEIMTISPIAARSKMSREEILSIMLKKQIRHLPVVDNENHPIGLELLKNQYDDSIGAAVLMAGGKGTRLRPLTDYTPKPLVRIGENTILDNVLNGLKKSGVCDIAISVNYLGEQIKNHVKNGSSYNLSISYLEEKRALGTAGALSLIQPRPSKSFIVMNADLLTEIDYQAFYRFHKKENNDFSVCVRTIKNTIPYGVVKLSGCNSRIGDVVEKPEHSYLVNAGIYLMEPKIIELVPHNQFFDMVSLIKKAIDSDLKVGAFPIYEYWRDIGQHDQMKIAARELRKKKPVTEKIEE
ncbi:MAG: hypothetical protein A2020_04460 [Lentisphaerae bacterium GWF2_45_14]|nr:MAG: hypothetical protein A2020_04460 [Lentisphaerae bacterium GWF2_45_14]